MDQAVLIQHLEDAPLVQDLQVPVQDPVVEDAPVEVVEVPPVEVVGEPQVQVEERQYVLIEEEGWYDEAGYHAH